ncbi:hypothetical protein MTO96_028649 [Rhipicephalus appendiculatus]
MELHQHISNSAEKKDSCFTCYSDPSSVSLNEDLGGDEPVDSSISPSDDGEELESLPDVPPQFDENELLTREMRTPRATDITVGSRLLLFLMKMKHGLTFAALGALFSVHRTTASRVFYAVLDVLRAKTQGLTRRLTLSPHSDANILASFLDRIDPNSVRRLCVANCLMVSSGQLLDCFSRLANLAELDCVNCPLGPGRLFTAIATHLPVLSKLRWSIREEPPHTDDEQDCLLLATLSTTNLRHMYVETSFYITDYFILLSLFKITRIYATLVLPRSVNRRRGSRNQDFIRRCNSEACRFNRLLRDYCRRSRNVFYVDHGFEWLPPFRVLAADGLHPNFEGVALIAAHIRQLCFKHTRITSSSWRDFTSSETSRYPTRTVDISANRSPAVNASLGAYATCSPRNNGVLTECATQTSPNLGRR